MRRERFILLLCITVYNKLEGIKCRLHQPGMKIQWKIWANKWNESRLLHTLTQILKEGSFYVNNFGPVTDQRMWWICFQPPAHPLLGGHPLPSDDPRVAWRVPGSCQAHLQPPAHHRRHGPQEHLHPLQPEEVAPDEEAVALEGGAASEPHRRGHGPGCRQVCVCLNHSASEWGLGESLSRLCLPSARGFGGSGAARSWKVNKRTKQMNVYWETPWPPAFSTLCVYPQVFAVSRRFRVTKCDKAAKQRRTLLITDSNGSVPSTPTEAKPKSRTTSESQQVVAVETQHFLTLNSLRRKRITSRFCHRR